MKTPAERQARRREKLKSMGFRLLRINVPEQYYDYILDKLNKIIKKLNM